MTILTILARDLTQHAKAQILVHRKSFRSISHLDRSGIFSKERKQHTNPKWSRMTGENVPQNHLSVKENSFSTIHANANKNIIEKFNNHKYAHSSKSISELVRAILVFHICQIKILVKNAESFANFSTKIFGTKLTNFIMKQTFFMHFCGGEDEKAVQSTVYSLQRNGIRSILDFAAEDDMKPMDEFTTLTSKNDNSLSTSKPPFHRTGGIYDSKSQENYDSHVNNFLSCIRTAKNVSNSDSDNSFAALKLTALGNPILLERMSVAIAETKQLFAKFDHNKDGIVTRDEFKQAYQLFFKDSDETLASVLDSLDREGRNNIDYITWSQQLKPTDLPRITSNCRSIGPLTLATPSMREIELMEEMRERVKKVANEAFKCKTRLLVDAEQSQFQPAIDGIVFELQKEYNCITKTKFPIIFNTYQCYLKDVHERLAEDVERSRRFSYHFAAKLVRGAYMVTEKKRSEKLKIPSPIHETIDGTHASFNDALEFLIRHKIKSNSNLEIMCATHNQYSIERAIELMHELNIQPSDSTVSFAQLYGMQDNITGPLGKHGFRAYKYIPYGSVGEVMPYLIRRAQENSDILGNASIQLTPLYSELKERLKVSL